MGRAIAQASHLGRPGSSPGQVMLGLWWTKWHWGRFSPGTSVSPAISHSADYSTFIIIYHPGLEQYAKLRPTYQVDSVSPHPTKIKQHICTSSSKYTWFVSHVVNTRRCFGLKRPSSGFVHVKKKLNCSFTFMIYGLYS
jgi:hypothetical protein